jgi:hypothetical protein
MLAAAPTPQTNEYLKYQNFARENCNIVCIRAIAANHGNISILNTFLMAKLSPKFDA